MRFNEQGPIAESYDELQSIPALRAVRERVPLPRCSAASLIRTILQASEIAFLNIHDLMSRATNSLQPATLNWAAGFHRILEQLSLTPQICAPVLCGPPLPPTNWVATTRNLGRSPGYRAARLAIRRFDRKFLAGDNADLHELVRLDDPTDPRIALLQIIKLCSHTAAIWERNLWGYAAWIEAVDFPEAMGFRTIREAVCAFPLRDETHLMQFRGLHQIPELLALECGDHLEAAIRSLQSTQTSQATIHLNTVNELLQVIVTCLRPMTENLTVSEYHKIRENLGLTSGSHSIALRYRAFGHLYRELAREYLAVSEGAREQPTFIVLHNALLRFRAAMTLWRDLHVHLPRNNLGSGNTRSLIGSPDALAAVQQMRADAARRDPLHQALDPAIDAIGPLATYLSSDQSLDYRLLAATAEFTQQRFSDVQERTGYFSAKPHFVPPRDLLDKS